MSKYRKMMLAVLIMELLMIAAGNILWIRERNRDSGRLYRVECRRVANDLKERLAGVKDIDAELQNYDLTAYETITGIRRYNPKDNAGDDYVVEEIDSRLYQILYRTTKEDRVIYVANAILAVMFLLSVFILLYVDRKVFQPFYRMQELSIELAKGNLSVPVREEKSRFFGRFLWGMDMLRESLEEKKEWELKLQKERKTLILSLSHDIKTPLSAIELYVRALREGLYDAGKEPEEAGPEPGETAREAEEAYAGIQKNVEEIKNYVNEITQASREDFLDLEVQNGELYLQDLIARITAYYREKLAVRHTIFTVSKTANCLLWGDRDRLIEVLQNIMENAIKYGDGERIELSFDVEENCQLIRISNTGEVPKEEELPHLTESFYRGSNHGREKGSGLGLYICRHLMKKMDGDLFAEIKDNLFSVTVVVKRA